MTGAASIERDCSPCNGPSHQIRAGFDAIWNDVVIASVQLTDAFDRDDIRPGTDDASPSLHEKVREIRDLRFLRSIFNDRGSLSERRSHHQIFCPGNRWRVAIDLSTLQPLRFGANIPVFHRNFRTHFGKSGKMEIDGP